MTRIFQILFLEIKGSSVFITKGCDCHSPGLSLITDRFWRKVQLKTKNVVVPISARNIVNFIFSKVDALIGWVQKSCQISIRNWIALVDAVLAKAKLKFVFDTSAAIFGLMFDLILWVAIRNNIIQRIECLVLSEVVTGCPWRNNRWDYISFEGESLFNRFLLEHMYCRGYIKDC